jgi:GH15 family glucan-1,4-alpha-glucosidase
MEALWVAACPDEANRFFAFLAGAAASQLHRGTDLQIMFGIGGEHDLTERELPHLSGWRQSRPVRVGNDAWNQRQLDVYGELLGAAQQLVDQLGQLDEPTRQFLLAAADTAAGRWTEQDQGIWEIRGEPRDFLYSKLMCWVALDRAIALAQPLQATDRIQGWTATREAIRSAICERGWSDRAGAYTQAFGTDDLDASNLMLAITGFLPGDDPQMKATIDATAERLTDQRAWCIATGPTTAWRAPRAPSCSAPSGWPRPRPWPARSPRPGRHSSGRSPTPTTSACWPRRSTPAAGR